MSNKKLLISLAHPDDEAFGSGGLIGKYVAEGVEVYYICATKGDRGTISEEYLQKYGSVAAVRDAELDAASKVLGFKKVYKLGYSDSGMMGSEFNNDPASLWQADENVVAGQIVEIMREVQPQVVMTFDAYGGYGHPDHIFMHRATTRAFQAISDSSYQPQKLYYTVLSRRLIRFYILNMRLRRQDPRRIGVNKDINYYAILENAQIPTTTIHVLPYLDVWMKASMCHASQVNPRMRMSPWMQRIVSRRQHLYRAYPEFPKNAWREQDLFEGIKL